MSFLASRETVSNSLSYLQTLTPMPPELITRFGAARFVQRGTDCIVMQIAGFLPVLVSVDSARDEEVLINIQCFSVDFSYKPDHPVVLAPVGTGTFVHELRIPKTDWAQAFGQEHVVIIAALQQAASDENQAFLHALVLLGRWRAQMLANEPAFSTAEFSLEKNGRIRGRSWQRSIIRPLLISQGATKLARQALLHKLSCVSGMFFMQDIYGSDHQRLQFRPLDKINLPNVIPRQAMSAHQVLQERLAVIAALAPFGIDLKQALPV